MSTPSEPAAPSAPPADTAAELADALTRAMKRIRRQTMARLEPYGLTPGQARALRTLAHAPGCEGRETMRLSELAERLHIAPAPRPPWWTRWRRPDWWSGCPTRRTDGPSGSC
ncbi:MarR family winged helix-turn-helix transcriptional regulator [Kitasatospora gansuensis]